MSLSLLVALILTPALCALILKPKQKTARWAAWFNQKLENLKQHYLRSSSWTLQHRTICLVILWL